MPAPPAILSAGSLTKAPALQPLPLTSFEAKVDELKKSVAVQGKQLTAEVAQLKAERACLLGWLGEQV